VAGYCVYAHWRLGNGLHSVAVDVVWLGHKGMNQICAICKSSEENHRGIMNSTTNFTCKLIKE
jgi:hypothetical protein